MGKDLTSLPTGLGAGLILERSTDDATLGINFDFVSKVKALDLQWDNHVHMVGCVAMIDIQIDPDATVATLVATADRRETAAHTTTSFLYL